MVETIVRRSRGRAAAFGSALLAVVFTAGLLVGPVSPASGATDRPLVTGWLPSWGTTEALTGIQGNAGLFNDASPFWYSAHASGGSVTLSSSVSAQTRATVSESLGARGIALIPSVADSSSAKAMASVLKDPAARLAHVNQLVDLALANGFAGIELDYEKFAFSDGSGTWAETRPVWVEFVAELAAGLHAQGKQLALAVPPIYDGNRNSSSGYWVYDYAGVAPYVDSLRIMTYDYSVSRPGPIAPLSFLRRTLTYAVTAFPASRIRMGVPAYGRFWTARRSDGSLSIAGSCPKSGVPGSRSFTTATALEFLTSMAGQVPTITFDPATGESVAKFSKKYVGPGADGATTSCVVDHIAWWVDSQGLAARLPLVAEFGLAGIAVWQLGGVDAASWQVLQAFAPTWTPPAATPTTAPVVPAQTTEASAPTVSATVSTHRPKRGQQVRVRVLIQPAQPGVVVKRKMLVRGKWQTLATKRTDAEGRVTFKFRWPRKDQKRTYRIVTKRTDSLMAGASAKFRLRTR